MKKHISQKLGTSRKHTLQDKVAPGLGFNPAVAVSEVELGEGFLSAEYDSFVGAESVPHIMPGTHFVTFKSISIY